MEDPDAVQDATWERLHQGVMDVLAQYGIEDGFGDGDYWINFDNYGWTRIELGIQNLDLFRPQVVGDLRALLRDLPEWEITMAVDVIAKKGSWPIMGLTIRRHEIIDGLQRDILPDVFRTYHYADSRPGTGYD